MITYKCPKCPFEPESPKGFRTHMTRSHGGYSTADLEAAGITQNTRDVAKGLTPLSAESHKDVRAAAPTSDAERAPGEEVKGSHASTPTGRKPKAVKQAELDAAQRTIIKARARRIAKWKYSAWAMLVNDPTMRLTPAEEEELTEAWALVFEAYGWVPGGKGWALAELIASETACVAVRSDYVKNFVRSLGQPPQPEQKEPVN